MESGSRSNPERARAPRGLRLLLTSVLLGVALVAAAQTVERGVRYAEGDADDGRSLDLFLPLDPPVRPPLVIFVHSRFWSHTDREKMVEAGFTRGLQVEGAAVAIVRHRLAPEHRHPAHAEDVAAAVVFLRQHADRYGYDPERIFLAGHGSGAHLAALVALDPQYLEALGSSPDVLAGVVAISGVFDLDPSHDISQEELDHYEQAFGGAGTRRAASPRYHVRGDAPPFLLLVAERDVPGYYEEARALAESLRQKGHPNAETFAALGRNHLTILHMMDDGNPARRHLFAFIGLESLSPTMSEMYAARRYWRNPGYSTEGFFDLGVKIESQAATPRLVEVANRLFTTAARPQPLVRPERFHSLDLFALLEALGPERVGTGPHLALTNARGERWVAKLEDLRPYGPRVVIGTDDERNLFRITDVYHTLREYSWRGRERASVTMARPLGGFLFFEEEPPPELGHPVFGLFALTPESFRLLESDPLAPVDDLPPDLKSLVVDEFACLSCHSFRGTGARAAHIRASDGALVGGYALPLESYPPEVWRRYVFEQPAVAREIGATPVPLDPAIQQPLHDLVAAERGP